MIEKTRRLADKPQPRGAFPFRCEDGPMKGHTLWLSSPTSAMFSIRVPGEEKPAEGRYMFGKWKAQL